MLQQKVWKCNKKSLFIYKQWNVAAGARLGRLVTNLTMNRGRPWLSRITKPRVCSLSQQNFLSWESHDRDVILKEV
jgi:hypothetical protein